MRRRITYPAVCVLTFALGVAAVSVRPRGRTVEGPRAPAADRPAPNPGAAGGGPAEASVLREWVYPNLFQRVDTPAGAVEIVRTGPLAWRVTLGGETVFEDDESLTPDVLKHVKGRVPPYDEVLVFGRPEGTYCNGGTFWFLGLRGTALTTSRKASGAVSPTP